MNISGESIMPDGGTGMGRSNVLALITQVLVVVALVLVRQI